MSIHALHDDHGRTVRYLRLSLTDRCNLRCLYCHSNARHQCIPHEKVLRYEEMIRLVQIVRGMGVGKVRLTGGEPFARKGCDDFLLRLRQRFDDLDIRITTNGTLLEEHIPLLQRIRISAVNLSLDSFDRETFARVTGRDMLPEVLRALDAMLAAGIRVKINAVGLRGIQSLAEHGIHAAHIPKVRKECFPALHRACIAQRGQKRCRTAYCTCNSEQNRAFRIPRQCCFHNCGICLGAHAAFRAPVLC